MGSVIPFPEARARIAFGPEDRTALDRVVARMRRAGAVRWEIEERQLQARAYVLGAEDETLLIVAKTTGGIRVLSGYAHELLWQGEQLASYA